MLKKIALILISILLLVSTVRLTDAEAALVDHFNKAIAIENHLEGHELDPIEGIWILRESLQGGQMFEIAIVPNTFNYPNYKQFDFVGITVNSTGFVIKARQSSLSKKFQKVNTKEGLYI